MDFDLQDGAVFLRQDGTDALLQQDAFPAPTISVEPSDTFAFRSAIGGRFSVEAAGNGLMYQWYKNGELLPGEVGPTLIEENIGYFSHNDTFYCKIENSGGSINTVNVQWDDIRDALDLLKNQSGADMYGLYWWGTEDSGATYTGASSLRVDRSYQLRGGTNDAYSRYRQFIPYPLWVSDIFINAWTMSSFADTDIANYKYTMYEDDKTTEVQATATVTQTNNNKIYKRNSRRFESRRWRGDRWDTATQMRVRLEHDRNNGTSNNCAVGPAFFAYAREEWEPNGDEHYDFVGFVLDCQGVAGTTLAPVPNLAPESGITWALEGNAKFDDAESVFGGTSVYIDGVPGSHIRSQNMPSPYITGTGETWELDMWVKLEEFPDSVNPWAGFLFIGDTTTNDFRIQLSVNELGYLQQYGINGGTNFNVGDTNSNDFGICRMHLNKWHYIRVVMGMTNGFCVFLDNQIAFATHWLNSAPPFPVRDWHLGTARSNSAVVSMKGWIGGVRWTTCSRGSNALSPIPAGPFPLVGYDPHRSLVISHVTGAGALGPTITDEVSGVVWSGVNAQITDQVEGHPYATEVLELTDGYIETLNLPQLHYTRPSTGEFPVEGLNFFCIEMWFLWDGTARLPLWFAGNVGSDSGRAQGRIDSSAGELQHFAKSAAGITVWDNNTSAAGFAKVGWNFARFVMRGGHVMATVNGWRLQDNIGGNSTNLLGANNFRIGAAQAGTVQEFATGKFADIRITYGNKSWQYPAVRANAQSVNAHPPYRYLATVEVPVAPGAPTVDGPQDLFISEFATAIFSVVATGSGPFTYQWYDSATGMLVGEVSPTLTFTALLAQNGRTYWCIVTDSDGLSTASRQAAFTVTDVPSPVIITDPVSQSALAGDPVTFSVVATTAPGAEPATYQWFNDIDGLLTGETADSLTFTVVGLDAGKNYWCEVSDIHGQTTASATAMLTVISAPMVVLQPVDTSAIEFRDVTFQCQVTGNGPFSYDWYNDVDGLVGPDAGPVFTFPAQLVDSGKEYYCIITDSFDLTNQTDNALLTVIDAQHPDTGTYLDVDIIGPPDVTIPFGQVMTMQVVILQGVSVWPVTIDWYNDRDGLVFADHGDTLTYEPPEEDDNLLWFVVIQDSNGDYGQSREALLDITPSELRLSWSIVDASLDTSVLAYTTVSWSVFDAKTANELLGFKCPLRTHRGLHDDGRTYWIPFYDLSARCSRGPLTNDRYNRYYWTQDGQGLKYAPLEQLALDSLTTGYDVGVPPPETAPSVLPPQAITDADQDTIVDRAYVYTYVTLFGEEGPPSPAQIASGPDSGEWEITNMATGPTEEGDRRITRKRLYRSVSTGGIAAFHYVAEFPVQVESYTDTQPTGLVGLNFTLESETWYPPPPELTGLTAHPNGFFVGYVGRDLYFSEPYRPHAWNPENVLSTIGDIVGLGIFGNTIVVCTNSHPYTCTGIVPSSMVLDKHDTAEPCLSRYGIVSMPFGVYYPGPNGLMLASPRGLENATEKLMTKEEWQVRYQVRDFDAARYQQQYVAFYSPTKGLMFDPGEPLAALVDLDLTGAEAQPDSMDSIFTDEYTGKTYLLDDCNMYEWNPVSGAPLQYDWTSMEFDMPTPVNLGAARIIWTAEYTPPDEYQTWAWRIWNTARLIQERLHPLNWNVLSQVRVVSPLAYDLSVLPVDYTQDEIDKVQANLDYMDDQLPNFAQKKQTFHWGPLIWVPVIGEKWPNTPLVIMQLIVNETVVYTKEITHTKMFRLPTGFKGTRYRIRLRSNIHIQSCKLAETGKELKQI